MTISHMLIVILCAVPTLSAALTVTILFALGLARTADDGRD